MLFFLMIRRPPRSTRTDTLCPYTTLFRSIDGSVMAASMGHAVNTAQVSLADVWEVRRTLELRTAELAAIHRSEEQAHAILTAAHGLSVEHDEAARSEERRGGEGCVRTGRFRWSPDH